MDNLNKDDQEVDYDELSDEAFMKLDPPTTITEEEEVSDVIEPNTDDDQSTDDPVTTEDVADESESSTEDGEEGEVIEPTPEIPDEAPEVPEESNELEELESKDKKTDKKALDTKSTDAIDFFEKVSAPFKADGKTMQVRTSEDAIRLMQMGVNYSRRLHEMKPLRAQDQMLRQNGLNDPEKLNYLIDLYKGNKEAIKKLLIDHKIDPIDVDTSTDDTVYRANDYQVDPKDSAFDEAIKETLAQDGGNSLISDINSDWDGTSKEALREQPSIFQNILAQRQSGVYAKIKTELDYQKTMGYLSDVPFLSAYYQVGEAMEKAGVFKPKDQPVEKKSIGTGTRKAALKPKTEQPNPNVSSAIQPRSAPANAGGQHTVTDYSSMSDEDFLKMSPP